MPSTSDGVTTDGTRVQQYGSDIEQQLAAELALLELLPDNELNDTETDVDNEPLFSSVTYHAPVLQTSKYGIAASLLPVGTHAISIEDEWSIAAVDDYSNAASLPPTDQSAQALNVKALQEENQWLRSLRQQWKDVDVEVEQLVSSCLDRTSVGSVPKVNSITIDDTAYQQTLEAGARLQRRDASEAPANDGEPATSGVVIGTDEPSTVDLITVTIIEQQKLALQRYNERAHLQQQQQTEMEEHRAKRQAEKQRQMDEQEQQYIRQQLQKDLQQQEQLKAQQLQQQQQADMQRQVAAAQKQTEIAAQQLVVVRKQQQQYAEQQAERRKMHHEDQLAAVYRLESIDKRHHEQRVRAEGLRTVEIGRMQSEEQCSASFSERLRAQRRHQQQAVDNARQDAELQRMHTEDRRSKIYNRQLAMRRYEQQQLQAKLDAERIQQEKKLTVLQQAERTKQRWLSNCKAMQAEDQRAASWRLYRREVQEQHARREAELRALLVADLQAHAYRQHLRDVRDVVAGLVASVETREHSRQLEQQRQFEAAERQRISARRAQAASSIQIWWRREHQRRVDQQRAVQWRQAAVTLQRYYKGHRNRHTTHRTQYAQIKRAMLLRQIIRREAATVIQCNWRGYYLRLRLRRIRRQAKEAVRAQNNDVDDDEFGGVDESWYIFRPIESLAPPVQIPQEVLDVLEKGLASMKPFVAPTAMQTSLTAPSSQPTAAVTLPPRHSQYPHDADAYTSTAYVHEMQAQDVTTSCVTAIPNLHTNGNLDESPAAARSNNTQPYQPARFDQLAAPTMDLYSSSTFDDYYQPAEQAPSPTSVYSNDTSTPAAAAIENSQSPKATQNRAAEIASEWGFSNQHLATLMLKKQQQADRRRLRAKKLTAEEKLAKIRGNNAHNSYTQSVASAPRVSSLHNAANLYQTHETADYVQYTNSVFGVQPSAADKYVVTSHSSSARHSMFSPPVATPPLTGRSSTSSSVSSIASSASRHHKQVQRSNGMPASGWQSHNAASSTLR